MPKSKRDKTTGLPLPTPVVPATSICLSIQVPNAIEYRSALKGALSSLGQAWTWAQTAGEDNQASYEAAELWRSRLQDAIYTLDCGGTDMSCEDVADCIDSNETVRTAIQNVVPTAPIDGLVYPPGTPLTPGQMTARLNEIDACAFDPFWAQTEQYVDFMVNLGQDVLEQIASYSAAIDLGENVPMGQFLGKLKNTSTAGKVVEFLQWALTTVKAAYEAADTAGNRNDIKCDIFCAHRDDCLITIQGTLDVLNARLGGLLTPGDLTDLPTMVTAFTTAAFDPALALDLWILFLMGSAKTAGMFGLAGIDETLQLVLATAVNDANNDWVLLCDDCDEPPPPDPECVDLTATQEQWLPLSSLGVYHAGEGLGPVLISGNYYFIWNRTQDAVSRTITEMEFVFNQTPPEMLITSGNGANITLTPSSATILLNEGNAPDLFPFVTAGAGQVQVRPSAVNGFIGASGTLRMSEFCFRE